MRNILENKKGILPSQWIGLVVIIGMLVSTSMYWIGEWDGKYSPIESAEDLDSYNKITDMAIEQNEMESKLQPEETPTTIGWLDFIITGGYQVLRLTLAIPAYLITILRDATGKFGIPRVFVDGFVVLISAAALFGIIGAIFRRRT